MCDCQLKTSDTDSLVDQLKGRQIAELKEALRYLTRMVMNNQKLKTVMRSLGQNSLEAKFRNKLMKQMVMNIVQLTLWIFDNDGKKNEKQRAEQEPEKYSLCLIRMALSMLGQHKYITS